MPLTTEDLHDLIRLVEAHPEWRTELRRLVLTDELLSLPEHIAALAEAQRRTEVQVAALTDQVTALVQSVQKLTDDMGTLKGKSLEADYRVKGHAYFSRVEIGRASCRERV